MKSIRLVFSYLEKLDVYKFIAAVALIISKIKAHPELLPDPSPSTDSMEEELGQLLEDAEAAADGDRNLIQIRDEQRDVVYAQVIQQGSTIVFNGLTAVQADTLGFRVAKGKSPSQPVDAPTRVKAKATGTNHSAEVSWRRPKNANSFLVEVCYGDANDPNATWVPKKFTTHAKALIEDLTPDMDRIWIRVSAFGAKGQSGYSVPVNLAVY